MSDSAILTIVPQKLIEAFPNDWNDSNCKGMPNKMPDPAMGDQFCSVYISGISGNKTDDGVVEETHQFSVTVTKRLNATPFDRISELSYLGSIREIEPLVERIKARIANRWDITKAINDYMLNWLQTTEYMMDHWTDIGYDSPPKLLTRNPQLQFFTEEDLHGTHGTPKRTVRDGKVAVGLTLTFGNMIRTALMITGDC